jgi:DNA-binding response OmpR family regulator
MKRKGPIMTDDFVRILLVDDDDQIRRMIAQMLSRIGYEVISADSGELGLSLFAKNRFDLVMTDLEMPAMDGWILAHQIKNISVNTPIILMTGNDECEIRNKFEQSPADQILFKPFKYREVINAIQLAQISILQP